MMQSTWHKENNMWPQTFLLLLIAGAIGATFVIALIAALKQR